MNDPATPRGLWTPKLGVQLRQLKLRARSQTRYVRNPERIRFLLLTSGSWPQDQAPRQAPVDKASSIAWTEAPMLQPPSTSSTWPVT